MSEVISRIPPSSTEAEQSILGAMLLSEECVHMSIERLKRDDFYVEFHRRIWSAIIELTNAYMPVDIVTVTERLGKTNLSLDDLTYLTDLTQRVPSVRNLPSYIDIVIEKSVLRKLLAVCGEVSDMCYKGEERAEDIVNYASSVIYRISQGKDARSLMHIHTALVEAYELISKAAFSKDGLMGIAIGFPMLDRMLSGLQASQLIIIAGRPGMGKTSFALNIVENVALSTNRPVAFFSLEMSRDQLAMRLMCSGAGVDSQQVRSGKLPVDDYFTLTDAMVPLEKSSIYIDDTPTIGPSEILSKCRRLKQERKDLALIVIDYLQLMTLPGRSGENRQQEVSALTRSLKVMARDLDVPIVLLSQLSRASEKRESKRPMLSDLRESGSIEQDADVVLFVHRESYYAETSQPTDKSSIIVAKQRSGPTGSVDVLWRGEQTKFLEVDYTHDI